MNTTELLFAGVAVFAILGMCWTEWRYHEREEMLRRKLGSCRTALAVAEEERAAAQKKCTAQSVELARYRFDLGHSEVARDTMRQQFNAQAVELARYRQDLPAHKRLTQTFVRGIPEPDMDDE